MTMLPAASARPDIVPVTDLLDGVFNGEYRVPRFQRPYVWSPDDMIQLYDSVLRGFPIGSLLIWQTDRTDISSLESIGPIKLPATGPALKSYVVDGHQRLATLLGVLRLPEDHPKERMDDWRWWIAYDLRAEQFIHLKEAAKAVPLHLLPLRSVLRTVDFARRTREIASSPLFDEAEAYTLLDRADAVQRAIRDYRIPLTVLRSGSLDDAVTIFARVNQRGRDMTADQMVSALTFRDRADGNFDLSQAIDDILGELRPLGFGDLQRRLILQVVLALAGMDFTKPSYERIVDRNSYSLMVPAVAKARQSLLAGAELLNFFGVKTSRLLPYASIIVMLAIYFSDKGEAHTEASKDEIYLLEKWFWATSFNGWFAGANTTDLRQAGQLMRSLAKGEPGVADAFSETFFRRPIRPFPEAFDRRSARVRASLLVQMLSRNPLDPETGAPIDGADVFGDVASRDIPYFFPNQRRPTVSNLANRVILPEGYPRNARGDFLLPRVGVSHSDVLASHFIDQPTFDALVSDDFVAFIAGREAAILNAEKNFLSDFGLILDIAGDRNQDENDADE